MTCDPKDYTDRINSFALVSYISGALGDFLDHLREELVMGCNPHAHITVLPPRPITSDPESAISLIESTLDSLSPFEVEIEEIRIFEATNVIYASVGSGTKELVELHETLNAGPLRFKEPYKYHPHLTLAQNFEPADLPRLYETAKRRWQEAAPAHKFVVDTLTFVQNTAANHWIDLMAYELGTARSHC